MADIERLRARIAELESQQSEDIMIGRRRVRPAGVIQNGRYYIIPRRSNGLVIVGWVIVAAFVVFVLAPLLIAPPQALMSVPTLGTADVRTRPTPPQNDSDPAPVSVPLFADATPEPAYDNAAYNATAQASKDILIVVTPTEEDRWADGEFWTDEEQAAFAATDVAIAKATTTAFIENVPTPAPDVVIEMEQKCADAALVARSPLLQLWCTPGD